MDIVTYKNRDIYEVNFKSMKKKFFWKFAINFLFFI